MNTKFSQKLAKVLSNIVCLVFVIALFWFNQPNANALTRLKETPSHPSYQSGISSGKAALTSPEPKVTESQPIPASEPIASPAIAPQESVSSNVARLLQTNECVGCNLAGAALKDTNLQAANLAGANLQGADLERAKLQKTNLSGANLQGADLGKTNITGANLANANLFDADLEKANLRGVNLEGANLEGADLEKTNLASANIQGANLKGADLEDAILPTAMIIN
jgi:uncharacterized protein YjbI with pentapeptide repeats